MTAFTDLGTPKRTPLPIIPPHAPVDVDAELQRFESEERARLGLEQSDTWVEDMANLGFTKSEKARVTLLLGGLTMAQDYLVEGGLAHLGYNTLALDAPDNDALRVGKEFGNRGQCNPTYFTVGNLVKFLQHLRDEKGMTTHDIIDKFVFLTAGACGPCRFGMYVTEYRKALRDAGFEGFRVVLFQQQGGLAQATGEESGLELTPPFFIAILKALVAGDVINGMGYRLRPYEVVPGSTDAAIKQAKELCYHALRNGKSVLWALLEARRVFKNVQIDRTKVRPRVAVIGEFWAMTTEGDGNYQLQRFLEAEGCEVDVQFVTAWILYNLWEAKHDTESRKWLRGVDAGRKGLAKLDELGVLKREVGIWAADKALRAVFQTFAHAVGYVGYTLPDMHEVARVAAPHYNNDIRGGEGHMEVGKLILNVVHNKATMTLSVKPFGCMPSSSVSDGVQSLITEKYPGTIYCPVETSGDGAVNFYSRVQMYLFKAKQVAEREMNEALEHAGMSLEEVRTVLAKHAKLGSALRKPAHAYSHTAADTVADVAKFAGPKRAKGWLRRAAGVARSVAARGAVTQELAAL